MHRALISALTNQMKTSIEELLPELQKNPTAMNEALICLMKSLKEIFVQLKPIEQTIEIIQKYDSDAIAEKEQLKQLQVILNCINFCSWIAVRLNCDEEETRREIYSDIFRYLDKHYET